jgi:hypothetical protein
LIEALGECEVLGVEMVLIAGDVPCGSTFYFAGSVGEPVPNRFAFAVFVPCAFDLVGGGGRPPEEAFGKTRLLNSGGRDRAGNLGSGKGERASEKTRTGCGEGRIADGSKASSGQCP